MTITQHVTIYVFIFILFQFGFINLLKPTGYVMHQEFNIQQL